MRAADPLHIRLLVATAVILGTAVGLAAGGVDMAVCLVVMVLAPIVTVVGAELVGHRHVAEAIERLQA